MESEQIRRRMMQALDGELDPQGQASLAAHLAGCADCQAAWDDLQAVDRVLREAPMVAPPAGFASRVMARVDRRRRVRRSVLGGLLLLGGTALASLLALAPTIWRLPGLVGDPLTLLSSISLLTARLADTVGTMAQSLLVTLGAMALSLVPLALCGLVLALIAGFLWLNVVRRLQPVATTLFRR